MNATSLPRGLRSVLTICGADEAIENARELCEAILAMPTFPAPNSAELHQLRVECPYRVQALPGSDPPRGVVLNFDRLPVLYEATDPAAPPRLAARELELFNPQHVWIGGEGLLGEDWEFMPRITVYGASLFQPEAPPWSSRGALEAYVDRLRDFENYLERRGVPRTSNWRELEAYGT